jgi:L-threonylcarbamoyladenylate synthase
MPVLPADGDSVARAIAALQSGFPVVLPLPSPLAYVVTGTRADAVNRAKGRPAGQPADVSVVNIAVIAPYLDLAADLLPLTRWLCESELFSLLVPVRDEAPGWLTPAISDGLVFFTAAPWLPPLAPVIGAFRCLYMSSANATGGQPATSAAEAGRAFGADLLVLDADGYRDQSRTHGSTTMVQVSRTGDLAVARSGINNEAFGEDLGGYAQDLSRRWQARLA